MFLITTLSDNIILTTALYTHIHNALESAPALLAVTNLIRYDKHSTHMQKIMSAFITITVVRV